MLKKWAIYSIYVIVAAGIGYYLIIKYGHNVQDIMQWIHTYSRYIAYAGASIVIGATLRQDKSITSKIVIGLLSIIHIISRTKIIIYDQYGAQMYMFVITTLSIICLYGILRIPKARIRSILILPILALTVTTGMLATSPFYEDIFWRNNFYNTQKIKLYTYINEPMLIMQQAQAHISVKNNNISGSLAQDISLTQSIQADTDLPNSADIQFASSIPLGNSALFIQSPEGDLYEIHSQSISTISIGSWGLLVQTTGIEYTGIMSQSVEQYKNKLYEQFNRQKAQYVENMMTNKIRNNVYIQYIWWKIIDYLSDKITYMQTYKDNFQKRQNMRVEADLPTNIDMSWSISSMPSIPLILTRRKKFTNPQ